jgi:transcriptional regulator with XRE-family HTH domain
MNLSKNLNTLLERKGITITRLSKEVGIPVQTLHGWQNGVEPKSLKQVLLVAKYFGMDIETLCFEDANKARNNVIASHEDEIAAGIYEVVLRKVKKY